MTEISIIFIVFSFLIPFVKAPYYTINIWMFKKFLSLIILSVFATFLLHGLITILFILSFGNLGLVLSFSYISIYILIYFAAIILTIALLIFVDTIYFPTILYV